MVIWEGQEDIKIILRYYSVTREKQREIVNRWKNNPTTTCEEKEATLPKLKLRELG